MLAGKFQQVKAQQDWILCSYATSDTFSGTFKEAGK